MKTILAAVDFSPITASVLKEARTLAAAIKARIVVLCVVQPPILLNDYVAVDYATFVAEVEQDARKRLTQVCGKPRKGEVSLQPLVVKGYPKATIIAQAKKVGADFIIIGSHGHGAFYDLVLGSTAHGVLSRATCPVVIIPAAARPKSARNRR